MWRRPRRRLIAKPSSGTFSAGNTRTHSASSPNTAEGWSQDVSEDIVTEVLERAFDGDDTLSEATKTQRFESQVGYQALAGRGVSAAEFESAAESQRP
jgi:hypothetical protein